MDSDVSDCYQVTTTLPDQPAAEQMAASLIRERLAACAQVLGPVSSTYLWKGQVERSQEWFCHLKTTLSKLPELQRRIHELHTYELPEIIALPISHGNKQYLDWIREETKNIRTPSAEPGSRKRE